MDKNKQTTLIMEQSVSCWLKQFIGVQEQRAAPVTCILFWYQGTWYSEPRKTFRRQCKNI